MALEYVIYCDESLERGEYFSNFYGGCLVRSTDIDRVKAVLSDKKDELHFYGEVKWDKITLNYADKYICLLDTVFDFVEKDILKFRIMFTQNIHTPVNLLPQHIENRYHILYYQFLKHVFGFQYSNPTDRGINLRIYLDHMPHKKEKTNQFKSYLYSLTHNPAFRQAHIIIKRENIAEFDSHEHDIAQCLDVILGSMQFRLNDKHKVKPENSRIRGKRTRAKEKVYKHINKRIQRIYPNFNIGITTGTGGRRSNRWNHPYRHWLFKPSAVEVDTSKGKRKKK